MNAYAKKTAASIFLIGTLVLVILSIIGTIYLSRMAYSDKKQVNGKYCGDLSQTERNIARLSVITIWILFAWIVLGHIFKGKIWDFPSSFPNMRFV